MNYLALGFPLKIIFGNIRGVMFVDAGAAWDGDFNYSYVNPNTGFFGQLRIDSDPPVK